MLWPSAGQTPVNYSRISFCLPLQANLKTTTIEATWSNYRSAVDLKHH
ncbi:hypothetical protein MTR67_019468 [Solanum verrucosum]|uniref:Uncharacterized protein n=1 Tax=Solanum verrucosum TaxID=315347 RepID=A0AAF0QMY7_SOLVR|nr:hypothetical protein MTR67_019468 [Solanum verrucosum]